jgi:ubiquinone/menaquinone biosynthesis C-methylase UbiE
MNNAKLYEKKKIIQEYSNFSYLFKPELSILNTLRNDLPEMKMLDIGVGGGRTTNHFAQFVKDYTAIDYSIGMINACKRKFKLNSDYKFLFCDVRNLQMFSDNQFDIVLFSYNGLDYISHNERDLAFREIYRITKKEAYFVFSTHNLQCLNNLYRIKLTYNPLKLLKRVLKLFLILLFNGMPNRYSSKEFAIINDGAHRFCLKTYYIMPLKQIESLINIGFNRIKLFSINDGEEIQNADYKNVQDDWIYYFCRTLK